MASLVFASIEDLMPENPDALHLLGVIAHQEGKNELAVKLITKAVAANSLEDALLGQRDAGLLDAVGPRGEPLDAPVGAEQVGLALDLGVEARLVVEKHAAIVALDVALDVVAVVREAHVFPFSPVCEAPIVSDGRRIVNAAAPERTWSPPRSAPHGGSEALTR